MTVRSYVKCNTCDQHIILRILLGHNTNPKYTFLCPNCGEALQIGMNLFPEKAAWEYVFDDSCSRIEEDESGEIVNISAELPMSDALQSQDLPFVAMQLMKTVKDLEFEKPGNEFDPRRSSYFFKNWKILKRASKQIEKGNIRVANKLLKNYRYLNDTPPNQIDDDIFSRLHDFLGVFLLPKKFENVKNILELMKNGQQAYPDEYKKFFNYFIDSLFKRDFLKIIDYIDKYMSNFETLFPFLLYIRADKPIGSDIITTTFNFNSMKMFYGDSFELIGSMFEFLAIINNINQGRDYSSFNSMNLKKYKQIDKANRYNPFKDVPELYEMAKEFDSSIRNASHHGNISYKEPDRIIYKHGKSLQESELSVSEYLIKCNNIFISTISIFTLYLYVNEFSQNAINKGLFK